MHNYIHYLVKSQKTMAVLKEGEVLPFDKDPALVEPAELPHFADFQLIYEGRVQDYQVSLGKRYAYS